MARGSAYGQVVAQLWRPPRDSGSDTAAASNGAAPPTGFDLADVMELGHAPGNLERELLESRLQALPMRRLSVRRTKDKSEYAVHDEQGGVLLVARLRKNAQEEGIDIFSASGAAAKAGAHPVLRLKYDDDQEIWRLTSTRCSCCEYRLARHLGASHELPRRELARIRHRSEPLDNGGGLLRLEVNLPGELQDGGRAMWCPMQPQEIRDNARRINSRLPGGGNKGQSLALDFGPGGRCRVASSKNFALCLGDAPSAHSAAGPGAKDILQFGKIEQDHYCLDFRHPLSLVEAFGVALTTTIWL